MYNLGYTKRVKNIFPLSFSVMAAVAIVSFIGAYFVYEHFWPYGENAQTAATATDALRENGIRDRRVIHQH